MEQWYEPSWRLGYCFRWFAYMLSTHSQTLHFLEVGTFWTPRLVVLPTEACGFNPEKLLCLCLHLDQGDVHWDLKMANSKIIQGNFTFIFVLSREVWALWRSWLFTSLGEEGWTGWPPEVLLVMFPRADNKAIETVQWWLNVGKGY